MKPRGWLSLGLTLGAAGLLAAALQSEADRDLQAAEAALEDIFTARPKDGPAVTVPPAPGGGGFAQAAEAAGFQPLDADQSMDLSNFKPANPLPPGVPFIGFARLGDFTYEPDFEPWTDPFSPPKKRLKPKRSIPEPIQALNGKRVAVAGFMLPFDFQRGGTRHFGLLKSQAGCCFGQPPGLNEWVDVRLGEQPSRVYMDQPVVVVGTLTVKPILEAGNTMGLYSLKAETVEKAVFPDEK